MSEAVEKAINALRSELATTVAKCSEVKVAINMLLAIEGQEPEYLDVVKNYSGTNLSIPPKERGNG